MGSTPGMGLIQENDQKLEQETALTLCLAPSREALVWSMAFTANALALSVKLALPPSCVESNNFGVCRCARCQARGLGW